MNSYFKFDMMIIIKMLILTLVSKAMF